MITHSAPKLLSFLVRQRNIYFYYMIEDPPSTDSKYVDWRAKDAEIRSCHVVYLRSF